jgi:peptidoglycan/LPS O-acetylase OafA/YrhL
VIGYAYDDRWGKMSLGGFFKRRLTRLHPMVVIANIIGTCLFFFGASYFTASLEIPFWKFGLCFIMGMFIIPCGRGLDIRGWNEMNSFNGPIWTLTFEYIGNILYAIFIRRLSTKLLTILVVILGLLHSIFAIGNLSGYGSIGVGWTFDTINFFGGMLRMLFPFTLGMIISRKFKSIKLPYPFLISAIILITTLSIPYLSPLNAINLNGIYEEICIAIIFPLIVIIGASSKENSRASQLLGEISYPLYIIHYPIMYLFYQWLIETKQYTLQETYPVALFVVFISIILAFVLASFYDKPIRKRLKKYS